jgi:hypothetical protein
MGFDGHPCGARPTRGQGLEIRLLIRVFVSSSQRSALHWHQPVVQAGASAEAEAVRSFCCETVQQHTRVIQLNMMETMDLII